MRLLIPLLLLMFSVNSHPDVLAAENGKTYRLFAGGDIMLARQLPAIVHDKGPAWPLEPVRHLIGDADIALANLECVIATRGDFWDKGEKIPFYFRAPPFMVDVLAEAGFDVMMTANNHAMDFGPDALLEQLELLNAANIISVGSGRNVAEAAEPKYIKVGDMVLAIIGLTTYNSPVSAGEHNAGVYWLENNTQILKSLESAIAEARSHADLVIFSPHWGGNWTERPTAQRIELARALIDLGVDGIFGHSAHQLHGIEVYRGRPIVYDMGNLLWDSESERRGSWSAGFLLEFDRSGFTRLDIHPLKLFPGRTFKAEGADFDRVETLMMRLSAELDPATLFHKSGDALVVELKPEPRARVETTRPAILHEAGRSTTLPEDLRSRRSNVVYAVPPAWTETQPPVRLEHGIEFLGARVPRVVRTGSGFTAAIALRVEGPLEPGWQAMIRGVRRDGRDEFDWPHPVADGNWLPELWQAGETGLDLTLVRPPRLKGGMYDLYWRLEHTASNVVARPVEATDGTPDGDVPIGEIWVGSLGVERGPSGISWSGEPDTRQRVLMAYNITREFIIGAVWPGGVLLVIMPLAAFVWWRSRAK
jgi:poly-gamma-glutamate capsule biosynthesis protein CapA/YwtB (metallophosphatase superfamily)